MVKRLSKPGKPLKKTAPPTKGKSLTKKDKPVLIKQTATSVKTVAKPAPVQQVARTGETGPIPKVPKGFKWKGKKDPYPAFKKTGILLVLPKDMPKGWPRLHKNAPPQTWWRVDPKGKRPTSLVTLLPDGVYTGWDTCHTCHNVAFRCPCKNGILHDRGVEWVWISQKLRVDDVDFVGKGTGTVDATQPAVRERALHHYKGRETAAYVPTGAARVSTGTRTLTKAAKPADRVSARPKTLTKKKVLTKPSKPKGPQVDVRNLDITKLTTDAENAAAASTMDALAKIKAAGKKPVKKTLSKKGKK